jgi:multidrug transporter EmrE-like cation transporter
MMDGRSMFAVTLVLICVVAGALGQIIWKQGMSTMDKINGFEDLLKIETIYSIFTNIYIVLGLIIYGYVFILWLAALSTLDVSFMYPMLSLAYVVTAIFAFLFLGESIAFSRWAGIAFVVIGCILIARS